MKGVGTLAFPQPDRRMDILFARLQISDSILGNDLMAAASNDATRCSSVTLQIFCVGVVESGEAGAGTHL